MSEILSILKLCGARVTGLMPEMNYLKKTLKNPGFEGWLDVNEASVVEMRRDILSK